MKKYPLRVQAAVKNLNACMAEIADFRRNYEEKRALKDEIMSTVEFI